MGIRLQHRDNAAVVTLDWPEKRNAIGPEQMVELTAALQEAMRAKPAGVVLTGNGAFCAGADLKRLGERASMPESERRALVTGAAQPMIATIVASPCPVFAAVDGPALGIGFDLALACDERFLGPDGWMMQGWGRAGVIAATGGVLLLQRLHPTVLWQLLADQPRLDAAAAERLCLGRSAEGSSALEAALACVESLAALPRAALHGYVALHRAALQLSLPAHLEHCAELQGDLLGDPALGERVAAILRQ